MPWGGRRRFQCDACQKCVTCRVRELLSLESGPVWGCCSRVGCVRGWRGILGRSLMLTDKRAAHWFPNRPNSRRAQMCLCEGHWWMSLWKQILKEGRLRPWNTLKQGQTEPKCESNESQTVWKTAKQGAGKVRWRWRRLRLVLPTSGCHRRLATRVGVCSGIWLCDQHRGGHRWEATMIGGGCWQKGVGTAAKQWQREARYCVPVQKRGSNLVFWY